MSSLFEATSRSKLQQLIALRNKLAAAIDNCKSMRDLAALSKQYRETIREIEETELGSGDDDEINAILAQRKAEGKPGAVRGMDVWRNKERRIE